MARVIPKLKRTSGSSFDPTQPQSISAPWTFSPPPCVTDPPVQDCHLTNKEYVDDEITLHGFDPSDNQNITGDWTFTPPPETPSVPTLDDHLTNKLYVDTEIAANGFDPTSNQNITGTWDFNPIPTSSTIPTLDDHLTNKLYVDTMINDSTSVGLPAEILYVPSNEYPTLDSALNHFPERPNSYDPVAVNVYAHNTDFEEYDTTGEVSLDNWKAVGLNLGGFNWEEFGTLSLVTDPAQCYEGDRCIKITFDLDSIPPGTNYYLGIMWNAPAPTSSNWYTGVYPPPVLTLRYRFHEIGFDSLFTVMPFCAGNNNLIIPGAFTSTDYVINVTDTVHTGDDSWVSCSSFTVLQTAGAYDPSDTRTVGFLALNSGGPFVGGVDTGTLEMYIDGFLVPDVIYQERTRYQECTILVNGGEHELPSQLTQVPYDVTIHGMNNPTLLSNSDSTGETILEFSGLTQGLQGFTLGKEDGETVSVSFNSPEKGYLKDINWISDSTASLVLINSLYFDLNDVRISGYNSFNTLISLESYNPNIHSGITDWAYRSLVIMNNFSIGESLNNSFFILNNDISYDGWLHNDLGSGMYGGLLTSGLNLGTTNVELINSVTNNPTMYVPGFYQDSSYNIDSDIDLKGLQGSAFTGKNTITVDLNSDNEIVGKIYSSIQDAIDYVVSAPSGNYMINIIPNVYEETITIGTFGGDSSVKRLYINGNNSRIERTAINTPIFTLEDDAFVCINDLYIYGETTNVNLIDIQTDSVLDSKQKMIFENVNITGWCDNGSMVLLSGVPGSVETIVLELKDSVICGSGPNVAGIEVTNGNVGIGLYDVTIRRITDESLLPSGIIGHGSVVGNNIEFLFCGTNLADTLYSTDFPSNFFENVTAEGYIKGRTTIVSVSSTRELTIDECRDTFIIVTDAYEATLPAVSASTLGLKADFYISVDEVYSVNPNNNDRIILNGVAQSDGEKIQSSGVAGCKITLICDSIAGWIAYNSDGVFINGG